MEQSFTATKQIIINASPAKVWHALTTPEVVKQYMFGAEVVSDWKKGSPLVYTGEWQGKHYEDKGTILDIQPEKLLQATYFSSLSGREDRPENYTVISYKLEGEAAGPTTLTIIQTNEPSQASADQSAANWEQVLGTIKSILEA